MSGGVVDSATASDALNVSLIVLQGDVLSIAFPSRVPCHTTFRLSYLSLHLNAAPLLWRELVGCLLAEVWCTT